MANTKDIIERLREIQYNPNFYGDIVGTIADAVSEINRLRNLAMHIDVRIEADADRRREYKPGTRGADLTTLAAVKINTNFFVTPEFMEVLFRDDAQYAFVGTTIERGLRQAVKDANGKDILSLATRYPWKMR